MRKTPSILLIIAFLANTLGPFPLAQAQELALPAPGSMVQLSQPFTPPILKGMKIHLDNPFRFDFILDKGDSNPQKQLEPEATRLIKYFLASLTIPENDLWVNLSPYEKDRIIPQGFGSTGMGRDLLAEDYMLKQITASLIYPEGETGRKFWGRVYAKAAKKFGTTNIPVNTFNKVWIVPEKAVVYENTKAGTAYVVEAKLKVMLEQDYLSMSKHENVGAAETIGSDIVREIVIPELTKEVNEGRNFAQLRQVYNSLILATWYKKKIKDSILEQVYADKKKVAGVGFENTTPEAIYQRYLQAFKKGVFNYIKEDQDPMTQEIIPRKYFSGGVNLAMLGNTNMKGIDGAMTVTDAMSTVRLIIKTLVTGRMEDIEGDFRSSETDQGHGQGMFTAIGFASSQEEKIVRQRIINSMAEGHLDYFRRFVKGVRQSGHIDALGISPEWRKEEPYKHLEDNKDSIVITTGIDGKRSFWLLKRKEKDNEGFEKNFRSNEMLGYLLGQATDVNLTEIHFLSPKEAGRLHILDFHNYYLSRLIFDGNGFVRPLGQTPQQAFNDLLVANIFMGKSDPHIMNLGFADGSPFQLDHDAIMHSSSKERTQARFYDYFLFHQVIENIIFLKITDPGFKKDLMTVRTEMIKDGYSNGMRKIVREYGLGQGVIAAEELDRNMIRQSILRFKQLRGLDKIVKDAGYQPEQVQEVIDYFKERQVHLGRYLDEYWQILTGNSGSFSEMDKAMTATQAMHVVNKFIRGLPGKLADISSSFNPAAKETNDIIREFNEIQGPKAVDLGSANHDFLENIRKRDRNIAIIGYDNDLKYSVELDNKSWLVFGDARRTGLLSGSIDKVFINMPEPKMVAYGVVSGFIKEAQRILKPGGEVNIVFQGGKYGYLGSVIISNLKEEGFDIKIEQKGLPSGYPSSLFIRLYNGSERVDQLNFFKARKTPANPAMMTGEARDELIKESKKYQMIEGEIVKAIDGLSTNAPSVKEIVSRFIEDNKLQNPWSFPLSDPIYEEKLKSAQAAHDRIVQELFSDRSLGINGPVAFVAKQEGLNSERINLGTILFEMNIIICQRLSEGSDTVSVLRELNNALRRVRTLQDDLKYGIELYDVNHLKSLRNDLNELGIEILDGGKVSIIEAKWTKEEGRITHKDKRVSYRNVATAKIGLRNAKDYYLREAGAGLFSNEVLQYILRSLENAPDLSLSEGQKGTIIKLLSKIGQLPGKMPGRAYVIPGKTEDVEKLNSALINIRDAVLSGKNKEAIEKIKEVISFFQVRYPRIYNILAFKNSQLRALEAAYSNQPQKSDYAQMVNPAKLTYQYFNPDEMTDDDLDKIDSWGYMDEKAFNESNQILLAYDNTQLVGAYYVETGEALTKGKGISVDPLNRNRYIAIQMVVDMAKHLKEMGQKVLDAEAENIPHAPEYTESQGLARKIAAVFSGAVKTEYDPTGNNITHNRIDLEKMDPDSLDITISAKAQGGNQAMLAMGAKEQLIHKAPVLGRLSDNDLQNLINSSHGETILLKEAWQQIKHYHDTSGVNDVFERNVTHEGPSRNWAIYLSKGKISKGPQIDSSYIVFEFTNNPFPRIDWNNPKPGEVYSDPLAEPVVWRYIDLTKFRPSRVLVEGSPSELQKVKEALEEGGLKIPVVPLSPDQVRPDAMYHSRTLDSLQNIVETGVINSRGEVYFNIQRMLKGKLKDVSTEDLVQAKDAINDVAGDHAMAQKNTGGIDLTAANMNLQTQNAGEGIQFHLDPAMLEKLRNAPGFVPVITSVKPLTDLQRFLCELSTK